MQKNIYFEQFEPHAREIAQKVNTKMKDKIYANELDRVFDIIAQLAVGERIPAADPVTVYANARYVWCGDHWEKVGEIVIK